MNYILGHSNYRWNHRLRCCTRCNLSCSWEKLRFATRNRKRLGARHHHAHILSNTRRNWSLFRYFSTTNSLIKSRRSEIWSSIDVLRSAYVRAIWFVVWKGDKDEKYVCYASYRNLRVHRLVPVGKGSVSKLIMA